VFGLEGMPFFWELVTLIDVMLLGHWVEMKSVMGASKALEELASRKSGVKLETHLLEGIPYKEVVRMTEELDADLVVMGTHGRTGLKHLLLGSVAERVVRSSKVPVITVPSGEG